MIDGIHGRDLSIIMGLNNENSLQITRNEKKDCDENTENNNISEAEYWNINIKEMCINEFTLRKGKKTRREKKIIRDEVYDFMIADIDRRVVGENSIIICENDNNIVSRVFRNGKLQPQYILLCQHNLRVTGAEKCYLVSLMNCRKIMIEEVPRDEKVIKMIVEVEKQFWESELKKYN